MTLENILLGVEEMPEALWPKHVEIYVESQGHRVYWPLESLAELQGWIGAQIAGVQRSSKNDSTFGALAAFESMQRKMTELFG